jgi:hypothetical protein
MDLKTYIKETVSRDGYFLEGLNILISTFFVCADGFQLFITLYNLTLYLLLCNHLLILKMRTEFSEFPCL